MSDLHPNRRTERRSPRSKLCRILRAMDAKVEGVLGGLSPRRRSAWIIGISLLFAGAMVASSWFLGKERSQTTVFVLIALWWIPYSALASVPAGGRGSCGEGD